MKIFHKQNEQDVHAELTATTGGVAMVVVIGTGLLVLFKEYAIWRDMSRLQW